METRKAYFAGGCFWCVEHDLKEAPGVEDVVSGYMGKSGNPSYMDHEGYREAVEVVYDSNTTNFKKLTQYFLDHIDPTDQGGQFHDRGESYKSAIYYGDEEERKIAEALLSELDESHVYDKPVFVDVLKSDSFYKAEEYHQNYAEKNPVQYASYRKGSGRADFTEKTCAIREEKKILWKD